MDVQVLTRWGGLGGTIPKAKPRQAMNLPRLLRILGPRLAVGVVRGLQRGHLLPGRRKEVRSRGGGEMRERTERRKRKEERGTRKEERGTRKRGKRKEEQRRAKRSKEEVGAGFNNSNSAQKSKIKKKKKKSRSFATVSYCVRHPNSV